MNPQRIVARFDIMACDALAAEIDAYRRIDANRQRFGINACDVDICAYEQGEEVELRQSECVDALLHHRDPGQELLQHINQLEGALELG
ncbi:hypothetical protein D0544_03050 [Aestuariirhabdus litorea]|uniref:Uncharacterized protein n=2 Tax=Aestuariirhabdus litorea TaxID=2528527 RepID=A0A3P3VMX3_9GAMM|nr:hypothetical protein D0544_03050 [Aestuariirhabdus litorea]